MSQSHAAPSRADAAYHDDFSPQQTLHSQARHGGIQARHALITQYHAPIARYATRLTGRLQHSSCEDLVSEGMLVVIERLEEALSKPNPIAWLLVSARYHMQRYSLLDESDTVPSIETQTPSQRHPLHKELSVAKKLLAKWMTQTVTTEAKIGGVA
ncbi:hypothetical protein KDH_12220 [Dictyobacter sp. S3.2.2.5]|uniref:RNA polymerase sigma-70 region 2 domain-containing protein n=1 Tax=Dictyobacter halimunensis TaxID=3026934 RepID=A0ABQ6FPC7_9CHLR|nr:hypothetical protein KDH_12220 [Dictyobacter sp. S3.2.2.5]